MRVSLLLWFAVAACTANAQRVDQVPGKWRSIYAPYSDAPHLGPGGRVTA